MIKIYHDFGTKGFTVSLSRIKKWTKDIPVNEYYTKHNFDDLFIDLEPSSTVSHVYKTFSLSL